MTMPRALRWGLIGLAQLAIAIALMLMIEGAAHVHAVI